MTYAPLHHKYRPQTFGDLVGQEAIATTLANAIRQQRLAPAYLFAGPRGTGKTSSARILAKSLNCLSQPAPTEHPCGVCDVCRAIAQGFALDVIEIDAASNTGVDNIRELIERAQFAPVQCRYKIYVIDECHMLSTAAFNALLKTLEEPPDRVVFVLATTDPQRVLPTIISRCQRFDFRRIPLDAMVSHLRHIADQEQIQITDEATTLVAQIAQGGLRDAESLLDQLSLLTGEVTTTRVWDLVGAVPEQDLLRLLEAIAQDNPEAVLDAARHLMDRGREPLVVLQSLASFYRDLLIAKTAPNRQDLVALTLPTWERLCEFADQVEVATILSGQQHLRTCEVQVKNTTQPRLWLEVALLGLLPTAVQVRSPDVRHPSRTTRSLPVQSGPQPDQSTDQLSKTPPVSGPVQPAQATPEPTPKTGIPQRDPSPVDLSISVTPGQERLAAQHADPEPASRTLSISETPVSGQHSPQPVPQQEPDQTSSGPSSVPAPANVNLVQLWQQVLEQISLPSTQMLLRQQGSLIRLDGQTAQVGISPQWHKKVQEKLSLLEDSFKKVCQYRVKVTLKKVTAPKVAVASPPQSREGSLSPAPISPQTPPQAHAVRPSPPRSEAPATQQSAHSSAPRVPPATPSPPAQPLEASPNPAAQTDENEALTAAKSLAQFFNGEVVRLNDPLSEASDQTTELDVSEADEQPDLDDDVPF